MKAGLERGDMAETSKRVPGESGDVLDPVGTPSPPVDTASTPGDQATPVPPDTQVGELPVSAASVEGLASARSPHDWSRFETAELAIVCSHYDVGPIRAIKAFHRGSLRSPKVVLKTDSSAFLLKRRAPGRDDPSRVVLSHDIQEHLVRKRFPAPAVIRTRDGQGWVAWRGHVYEMFEYVRGSPYEPGEAAAEDAGKALGWFHRLAADFRPTWTPPGGTYHRHPGMARMLERLVARDVAFRNLAKRLGQWYAKAGSKAEETGIAQWPMQVIHGDWHPGNMIFRAGRVVGVVDYDAVRLGPRAVDVANGVLQFSIDRQGRDPAAWSDSLSVERAAAFIRGYDGVETCVLSRAELGALPWLMVEALIVESVGPVAATGNFGGLDGLKVLESVHRRVAWLAEHAQAISAIGG